MYPFAYARASRPEDAIAAVAAEPGAAFFAGGTTLLDLMKLDVVTPTRLVDVNALPLAAIEPIAGGLRIGALARMSDVARDPNVVKGFPVIAEALLNSASPQLRNMASIGGNVLQRTRCSYFRDLSAKCNKREPGSGCDALDGVNRMHAILGTSEACIATHASDLAVALAALDATLRVRGAGGERSIRLVDFYALPGQTPQVENSLQHGEMILAVDLPASPLASRLALPQGPRPGLVRVRPGERGGVPAGRRGPRGRVADRPGRRRHPPLALARGRGRVARAAGHPGSLRPRRQGRAGRRQAPHAQRVQERTGRAGDRPRPEHPGRSIMNTEGKVKANAAVGKPLNRVDGRLKVTGAATFSAEYPLVGILHAVIVQSTIARGRIKSVDAAAARKVPGVVAVYTHEDAPKLIPTGALDFTKFDPSAGATSIVPLQGPEVYHVGQHIGLVVADTMERAKYAASLVRVHLRRDARPDPARPRDPPRQAAQEHDGCAARADPRRRRGGPGGGRGAG